MKKIRNIFITMLAFISLSSVCYADVVMNAEQAKYHGMRYIEPEPTNMLPTIILIHSPEQYGYQAYKMPFSA